MTNKNSTKRHHPVSEEPEQSDYNLSNSPPVLAALNIDPNGLCLLELHVGLMRSVLMKWQSLLETASIVEFKHLMLSLPQEKLTDAFSIFASDLNLLQNVLIKIGFYLFTQDYMKDIGDNTLAHYAAQHNNIGLFTKLAAVTEFSIIDTKNKDGITPLELAVQLGREDLLEKLIRYPAFRSQIRPPIIQLAIKNSQFGIATLLLANTHNHVKALSLTSESIDRLFDAALSRGDFELAHVVVTSHMQSMDQIYLNSLNNSLLKRPMDDLSLELKQKLNKLKKAVSELASSAKPSSAHLGQFQTPPSSAELCAYTLFASPAATAHPLGNYITDNYKDISDQDKVSLCGLYQEHINIDFSDLLKASQGNGKAFLQHLDSKHKHIPTLISTYLSERHRASADTNKEKNIAAIICWCVTTSSDDDLKKRVLAILGIKHKTLVTTIKHAPQPSTTHLTVGGRQSI